MKRGVAMKATPFEVRHQTLLHLLVIGLAVGGYFVSRDDVVWAAVRHHQNAAFLERLVFAVGTLEILSCAVIETWAEAAGGFRKPLLASRLTFALALGLLLPLAGTIALLAGESLLVLRLSLFYRGDEGRGSRPGWAEAFRRAASKWGLFVSMILFTVTLQDRVAEIGAAASVLVWLALNYGRLAASMAE
jgi:hypothetical protein